MNNYQIINDTIIRAFDKNIPFSLIRVGNTEGYFLNTIYNGQQPITEYYNWIGTTAGLYPNTKEYIETVWYRENIQNLLNSDIVGFVDISETIKSDVNFLNSYCSNKPLFFKEQIEVLDPGTLLDTNKINNPWTKQLKGKRVLVVSSHEKTILKQWDNIENIWKGKTNEICPFELVGVVRSPFNPQIDSRQYPNCGSWDQTLDYMKKLIDSYDYDVLLSGSAVFSPSLADHAKKSGKIGITICGAIQLFFGILGSRWVNNQCFSEWRKLFNDNWIYPLEEDLPNNKSMFDSYEKAYW